MDNDRKKSIEEFKQELAERDMVFQKKLETLYRNLAEDNVTVFQNGQWTINDGSELTFDQAFGGPSELEKQAWKNMPR
jgi:hypothetical protein